MKTSTTRPKQVYQPVILTLTFETEKELNLFKDSLIGYDLTIPQTLYEKEHINIEQRNEMETMMRQIYNSLHDRL